MTETETSLVFQVLKRMALGLFIFAAMLFIPAGTLHFWRGWVFMAAIFIPSTWFSLALCKSDPQLMKRRFQKHEQLREQRVLVRLLRVVFFFVFLVPGFDFRFGWSRTLLGEVPVWLTVLSLASMLMGLIIIFWTFRTNTFASRTIQVEPNQTVISSGPYRLVRHPMYLGSIVTWVSAPLALGSYVTLPAFVLLIPFYIVRLLREETFLRAQLPGYQDYCERTRFRLVPAIW